MLARTTVLKVNPRRGSHPLSKSGEPASTTRTAVPIACCDNGDWRTRTDALAVERPLEIQIAGARPLITMRTPGQDRELTAGLLHNEGVVRTSSDIVYLEHGSGEPDVMRVILKPAVRDRFERIERNTLSTSACGVCGKATFRLPTPPDADDAHLATDLRLSPQWIVDLPARMRRKQGIFADTGGLHAAALFEPNGKLEALCEDIGRHNALDKLIGHALLADRLPLSNSVLVLSGRASFELMQKAIAAGIPAVCAISAPSSFAVELAQQFSVTLIGFLRPPRFNVYSDANRVIDRS